MKNKCIFVLLVCICKLTNLSAQSDESFHDTTIMVRLEKSDTIRFGVDLIFENTSSDTAMVLGRFKNFRYEWVGISGIKMIFFNNDNMFAVNWRGHEPKMYVLDNSRIIIPPYSKRSYTFDLAEIFRFRENEEYGTFFYINFLYSTFRDGTIISSNNITNAKTNRVIVQERRAEQE